MTDQDNSNNMPENTSAQPPNMPEEPTTTPPTAEAPTTTTPDAPGENDLGDRLERLGGEPAPVITPDEFARLQKAGQVHIDSRGRVRTERRQDAEAGVSLRKRRAWYGQQR